jgi:isopentenyl-diphosphate delta-isomerase
VIASGGLRDGVDVAKAIRLGADLGGMAAGVLEAALQGGEALASRLSTVIEELRIAAFCTGSRTLAELAQAPLVDGGSAQ